MARSIQEIYNELSAEKDSMSRLKALQPNADKAQTLLSDITSASKVADWRLWLWLMAFAVHIHEGYLDLFRKEIDAKVAGAKAHTLRWYFTQALRFQLGYALTYNTELEKYEYATADESAQIVKRAATEESQGRVIVKVADASGPITGSDLTAFVAYMNTIKDAGTDLLIVSTVADDFKVDLEVFYDPLVLNPDGSLILDSNRKPVEEQISAYIAALDFNGAFNKNKFIDALQAAEGVIDPDLNTLEIKSNIAAYAAVDVEYLTYSGHYAWDDANSVITYTPKNV